MIMTEDNRGPDGTRGSATSGHRRPYLWKDRHWVEMEPGSVWDVSVRGERLPLVRHSLFPAET